MNDEQLSQGPMQRLDAGVSNRQGLQAETNQAAYPGESPQAKMPSPQPRQVTIRSMNHGYVVAV